MQNEENQEDVTLENDITEAEETTEEVEEAEPVEETAKDWEAEAKKWEAIAKRKAKNATKVVAPVVPTAPAELDQELVDLTYRNYLTGIGLTSKSVQDEAMATAKRMQVPITGIQGDEALLAVFKQKQQIANTNGAMAKSPGGTAIAKKGVDDYVSKLSAGKPITEISGANAVKLLKRMK